LVFAPLDEQQYFTLEECDDDEGLNVHGDLPECCPSESILERDLAREQVFINPPWELADEIGQGFEHYRRITVKSTLAIFVLPKKANFSKLTEKWKMYQEFPPRMKLFTLRSTTIAIVQEMVAPSPWHVQLWLLDSECPLPTTPHATSTKELRVLSNDDSDIIAKKRLAQSRSLVVLSDHTEIRRPRLQIITFSVSTSVGQRHQTSNNTPLVHCAATLNFVSENFVTRTGLQTSKFATKTVVRLANGQRLTSTKVCDISLHVAQHDSVRTFYVLSDFCAADIVLALPWLDDEQATLKFGACCK
jgi:hypothetical protein